jgi:hypothetical protein
MPFRKYIINNNHLILEKKIKISHDTINLITNYIDELVTNYEKLNTLVGLELIHMENYIKKELILVARDFGNYLTIYTDKLVFMIQKDNILIKKAC